MANAATAHHAPVHNDWWPDMVARAGYVAKGVVYIIIGVLALFAAFNGGDSTVGSRDAIRSLLDEPFGFAMVLVLTIGLACYAIWRWLQTFTDPEGDASGDAKGWGKRLVYLFSAVIYTTLTVWAVSLLMGTGSSSGGGDSGSQQWSAKVMQYTGGQLLIGIIGACVIAGGVMELVKAYKKSYLRDLDLSSVGASARKAIDVFGRAGLAARAVVFWLIGLSLIYAAWQANAQQVESFGEALGSLRSQPYGTWLFVAVSIGVLAYGAFQVVKGCLRHVRA